VHGRVAQGLDELRQRVASGEPGQDVGELRAMQCAFGASGASGASGQRLCRQRVCLHKCLHCTLQICICCSCTDWLLPNAICLDWQVSSPSTRLICLECGTSVSLPNAIFCLDWQVSSPSTRLICLECGTSVSLPNAIVCLDCYHLPVLPPSSVPSRRGAGRSRRTSSGASSPLREQSR
jgi:hypothetical protein